MPNIRPKAPFSMDNTVVPSQLFTLLLKIDKEAAYSHKTVVYIHATIQKFVIYRYATIQWSDI